MILLVPGVIYRWTGPLADTIETRIDSALIYFPNAGPIGVSGEAILGNCSTGIFIQIVQVNDTFEIIVNGGPVDTVCSGTNLQADLGIDIMNNGGAGTWTFIPGIGGGLGSQFNHGDGIISMDPTVDNIDFINNSTDFVTDTLILSEPGFCDDTMYFVVSPIPIIDDLGDQSACDSFELPTITGIRLTDSVAYYTGNLGTGTKYRDGDFITTTTSLFIYDAYTDLCFVEQGPYQINILSAPSISGPDSVCSSANEVVFVENSGVEVTWSVNGINADLNFSHPAFNDSAFVDLYAFSTEYDTIIADNGSCSDTHIVKQNPKPMPIVFFDGNTIICQGDSVKLYTDLQFDGYSYQWYRDGIVIPTANDSVYFASSPGFYNIFITNDTTGCGDSSMTPLLINVNIIPTPEITGTTAVCFGDTFAYNILGTYNNIIWSSANGDIIGPTNTNSINIGWNTTGVDTVYLQLDSNFCNGYDTLVVNVLPEVVQDTANFTVCYGDLGFTSDTTLRDTVFNALGCDSLVFDTIYTVLPEVVQDTASFTVCYGDLGFTSDTTLRDTVFNALGCDSLVFDTVYTVLPAPVQDTVNTTICYGDLVGGVAYFSDTLISDTVLNALLCDSLIHDTIITVLPEVVQDTANFTVCYGDLGFTSDTTLRDTVFNALGCDSLVFDTIYTVLPEVVQDTASFTVCYGDLGFTSDTTLRDTVFNALGCDSLVHDTDLYGITSTSTRHSKHNNLLWRFSRRRSLLQ